MPDQLPSAILDSSNSFDSLFALNLDTKQRFDNILSGVQKPIDYPIPDYNKEFTPKGLPQEDLLNPDITKGVLGEALFSTDPKISTYATDRFRAGQAKLPVNQGIGVHDRFSYSKEMDKFLKGDYGYNPYMSIADNEDFNYRYDYLNQNIFERVFKNTATGLTRFVGSLGLKLGQSIGYLGAMIGNGVEEIFDGKDNNFMADVADNSLSRWFEGLEEDMKSSNLLSVFKPRGWEDMGFFKKLSQGAFWTDEVADGAAFMGEMVASMYLLGGLGKVGALGRIGQTEINLTKALSKLGPVGNASGRVLDSALKIATGANDLAGVGRWAFATASESAFEASGLYKEKKDRLKAEREAGLNEFTDLEIEKMAGDSAASSFKANMLILSASNAFENRFIFGPLFKRMGMSSPDPRGRLISVSKSTENLDELAKATRTEYNYKTWLGKKLDWKNSNSRLRFYGSRALSATAMEGFWEENAQLASERLATAGELTPTAFFSKLGEQTLQSLRGDDPEAATSIGLGALIGGGATTAISKIRGGDRLFQGERQKRELDTEAAIETYEEFRKGFLNYQDIFVRNPDTGKPLFDKDGKPIIDPATGKQRTDPRTQSPLMDSDGNLQIDPIKAAGLLDGTNQFLSQQMAADKVSDPLFRKHLQDIAMTNYVEASKIAGIFDKVTQRFNNLPNIDPQQLTNLGFDPNSTVDATYLKDSLKAFGQIYDSVQNAPPSRLKKGETQTDEAKRKGMLYKASAGVYSATKLIGEYNSKMMDVSFPSVFSPEAEGNTSEIQMFNSLVFQQEALNQFAEMAKEHGDFYDAFVKSENARIEQERTRLQANIDLMFQDTPLVKTKRGFYYTPTRYEGYTNAETEFMVGQESDAQKKHAEYTNIRNQRQFLANKFSNPNTGIQSTKDYLIFEESVHKKDNEADNQSPEPTGTPPPPTGPVTTPPVTPPGPATPPPTPAPTNQQILDAGGLTTALRSLITSGLVVYSSTTGSLADMASMTTLVSLIVENQEAHQAVILKELIDTVEAAATPINTAIQEGRLDRNSPAYTNLENTINFIADVMDAVAIVDEISQPVMDYMDGIANAISAYSPPVVTLSEAEQNAINILSGLPELVNSAIGSYVSIIIDPNASDSNKRQALKGLSDQYLAPETGADVGQILPPAAAEAIEALGYPVPVIQESSQEDPIRRKRLDILTATSNAVDSIVTLSDGSEYTVKIEARIYTPRDESMIGYQNGNAVSFPIDSVVKVVQSDTKEVLYEEGSTNPVQDLESQILAFAGRIVSGEQMTTAEDLQFYENNRRAIEAALKEIAAQPPVVEGQVLIPDSGDFLELAKVGKTRVVYDRTNKKYVYFTASGTEVRLPQAKKVSAEITPRFFRVWYRDLSDATQREALENISTDITDALQQAQAGQPFDTLELVLMRNMRKMKFTPSIMSNLTDVSKSAWTSEDGEPIDTFVSDFLLGQGNILEQNGFSGYDEQDLINRVLEIISEYPDGIRVKDITAKEKENDPGSKLKELEESFFNISGLDLIKSLDIYNNEKESLNSQITDPTVIPTPPPVPPVTDPTPVDTPDTEGSGIQTDEPPLPPTPPEPPVIAENSDQTVIEQENYIDVYVDTARLNGKFVFPQNIPAEVVMEGDQALITNGAIQLMTTRGDQQRQILRQHNILKQMGERTNPINFWSEDANGNPLYKIKLEMAGNAKAETYRPWVLNTAEGKKDAKGRPYAFPFIVAMVTDQQGNYVYFNDDGNISDQVNGMPFGFMYTVQDYLPQNLGTSRRGLQLGSGEPLNGLPDYKTDDPLSDIVEAIRRGTPVYGTILEVASGKLSTYNVDNSGATWSKNPVRRTVKEMEEAGDITETSPLVLDSKKYFEYSSETSPGAPTQQIKVGQVFLIDDKTGIKIPLRGKKIKDLTIKGQPFITGPLRDAIEGLQRDGEVTIPRDATTEYRRALEALFNTLRALVYSQNTPIILNDEGDKITMIDKRIVKESLLETEINYSTGITSLSNPFDTEDEGFSYEEFVKENFLSGAVPVELTEGQKSFEKLNRRIIFGLDKNHQEILDSIGAKAKTSKTKQVSPDQFNKFVNKTYRKRGGTGSTVTVTGFSDGNFTISGPSGTISQPAADFFKQLRELEEVKLPEETPEITQEFVDRKKLSKEELNNIREKSKNITDQDLDNQDFGCD